jgi:hypothetical protein
MIGFIGCLPPKTEQKKAQIEYLEKTLACLIPNQLSARKTSRGNKRIALRLYLYQQNVHIYSWNT